MFKYILIFLIFITSNSFGNEINCSESFNKLVTNSNIPSSSKENICQSLYKAEAFFKTHGFHPKSKNAINIVFADTPGYCNDKENKDADINSCDGDKWIQVAGLYNELTNSILVGNPNSEYMKNRKFFELPFSQEMYNSVVTHEFVHALSKQHYSYLKDDEYHAQDEYLAYVAQMDSMSDDLRNQVLNVYKDDTLKADRDDAINDMLHAMAPHRFGIMCYKHYLSEKGGAKMIKRILSGDFRPPTDM